MTDTTTNEAVSASHPAPDFPAGARVFDTGSEHENLRHAAAELTQRREAVAKEEPGFGDRTTKNFAAKVVGDYDADRLLGIAQHFRQEGEEKAGRNIGQVTPGRVLDKQEFSRGELRNVAREVSESRARDNFQRVMAALQERAQANQQSISEILGAEQAGPEAQPVETAGPAEAAATPASLQAPQRAPDPAIEQERARLSAARQQYEAAVPRVAAIALHELAHDAAQLRARGINSVEELAKADPAAYAQYTAKAQKLGLIAQEVQAIRDRAAQEQVQQWAAFATGQDQAFLQQNPEMADRSKLEAAWNDVLATLRETGIGDRELRAAYNSNPVFRDARVRTLLFRLSQAHMKQKRAAETLKGRRANPVPLVQRPGVSGPRPDHNQQRRAKLSEQLDKATGQKALKIAAEMRALGRGGGRRGGTPFV
jgi:hypothetical protein